jgi:hypothetical protein
LLQRLQWYGARPDELTVPDIGLRLLLEALCLWYELPGNRSSTEVAGFALEQRAHYGAGYATIRRDFLQHLEDSDRTSTTIEKHLLGWVCLAQFGPEFQVRDIPDDLPYASSVVWVNFVHGVHLAHALDPRLLEYLSFQQLVDLPLHKSQNASSDLQTLIAMTRAAAARTWTAATERWLSRAKPPTVTRRCNALEDHEKQLNAAILQLDIEPPRRLALAQQELDKALANDLYDHTTIRLKRYHHSARNRARRSIIDTEEVALRTWPLLEVYASGGLNNDTRWYVSSDGRNASEWISLNPQATCTVVLSTPDINQATPFTLPSKCTLPDIRTVFDRQFDDYLSKTRKAYEYLIKSLLVTLPWADRRALEHGEVRIHSLRDQTRHIEAHLETAENILPLRARMGFVLQVTYQGTRTNALPRAGASTTCRSGRHHGRSVIATHAPSVDATAPAIHPSSPAACHSIEKHTGTVRPAPTPRASPSSNHWASPPGFDDPGGPSRQFAEPELHFAAHCANRLIHRDAAVLCRRAGAAQRRLGKPLRTRHQQNALDSCPQGLYSVLGQSRRPAIGQSGETRTGRTRPVPRYRLVRDSLGQICRRQHPSCSRAAGMAIRVALPRMAQLSKNLLVSSLRNLNPLDAAPALLKLGGRGAIGAVRAVAHLEHRAVARLKNWPAEALTMT